MLARRARARPRGRAALVRSRSARPAPAAAIAPERERELESLRRIAAELARTSDVEGVARALLDEIASLFAVGFVALAFVSEDGREASGFLARANGKDVDWWPDVRVDLAREPSGSRAPSTRRRASRSTTSAARRASARGSRPRSGAKSAAFVPLVSDDRVIAVISVATTDDYRAFSADDLAVMQTLASEATIALERTRSAIALGEALERERLLASIGRRLRTELDLDAALAGPSRRSDARSAPRAASSASASRRTSFRSPRSGRAEGVAPIGDDARAPPGLESRAREERTVAIADIQDAPELARAAARRARAAARARRAGRRVDADRRAGPVDRRAHGAPRRAARVEPGRPAAARGRRGGVRARDPPRPAARREPRPARPADGAPARRAGAERRARARDGARSGSSTSSRSCSHADAADCYLYDARARRPALRGRARPRRVARRVRVPARRAASPGSRSARAAP